ncbi:MAG: tetratricopeptide repeat protein [Planctomycetota bacterium]|nr:tetratricopeptide repeat protein [Planctomycetota bacterium]
MWSRDAHRLPLRPHGRCYKHGGRPDLAEDSFRQGIRVTEQLEPSDGVKRHRGALHTELADVLAAQGKFAEAREQYEISLQIVTEVNDLRTQGVVLGQLGTLALREGDLADAVKRYHEALELFQRLGEPAMEAVGQHLLGVAFQEARQWEQAEHHYREAARLKEQRGDLAGAARTWNQLAMVSKQAGKPEAAETWYRKAIDGGRKTGDTASVSKMLNNLAKLLRTQPERLAEARQLAEASLAIKETLDPGAAEIWTTYDTLADIADQQGRPEQAAEYRNLARDAKRQFAGTAHEMKRFAPVIALVAAAAHGDRDAQTGLNQLLEQLRQAGGEPAALALAFERILAGERDAESLCANLGGTSAMIIETILHVLEGPTALEAVLPHEADSE